MKNFLKNNLLLGRVCSIVMTVALVVNLMMGYAVVTDISSKEVKAAATAPYRNVMYYGEWSIYEGQKFFTPDKIPGNYITHLNFAFLDVDENGNVISCDAWADFNNNTTAGYPAEYGSPWAGVVAGMLQLRNQYPNMKIGFSVGGWTRSGDFPKVAANPTARKNFAENIAKAAHLYGYDFVDIDWEYPTADRDPDSAANGVSVDKGCKGSAADTQNFTLLLQDLRTALDKYDRIDNKHYELSVAMSASPAMMAKIEYDKVLNIVDFANMMTYDLQGAWSPYTGHQTALYTNEAYDHANQTECQFSVDACIQYLYKTYGNSIDASKIVVGVAPYTRGWAGVQNNGRDPKNPGLFATATPNSVTSADGTTSGTYAYGDIGTLISRYGLKEYYDTTAEAAYYYSESTGYFFTCDNAKSVTAKANYVKNAAGYTNPFNKPLGGLISWMASLDGSGEITKTSHDALFGAGTQLPAQTIEFPGMDNVTASVATSGNDYIITVKNNNTVSTPQSQGALHNDKEANVLYYAETFGGTATYPKFYIKTSDGSTLSGSEWSAGGTVGQQNGYTTVDTSSVHDNKIFAPGSTITITLTSSVTANASNLAEVAMTRRKDAGGAEMGWTNLIGNGGSVVTTPAQVQTTATQTTTPAPSTGGDTSGLTFKTLQCAGNPALTIQYAIKSATIEGINPYYADEGKTLQFAYTSDAGVATSVTVNGQTAPDGFVKEKLAGLVKIDPTKLPGNTNSTITFKTATGEFTVVVKTGNSTVIDPTQGQNPTTTAGTQTTTTSGTQTTTTAGGQTGGSGYDPGFDPKTLTYETLQCNGTAGLTIDWAKQSSTIDGLQAWYGDAGKTFMFQYSADAGAVSSVKVNGQPAIDGIVTEKGSGLTKIDPTKLANDAYSVITVTTATGEFTAVIKRGKATDILSPTEKPVETTTPAPTVSVGDLDPNKLTYQTIECEDHPEIVLEYAIPTEYVNVAGIEPWFGDAGNTFMLKYAAVAGEVTAVKVNGQVTEVALDGIVKETIPGMVKINPTKLGNDGYSIITVVTETGEFTTVIKKGNATDIVTPPTKPIDDTKNPTTGSIDTDFDPNELTYQSIPCDGKSDLILEYAIPLASVAGIAPWFGDAGSTFLLQYDGNAGFIKDVTLNGKTIGTENTIIKEVNKGGVKIDPTKLADDAYSILVLKAEVGEITLVIKKGNANDVLFPPENPSEDSSGEDKTSKDPQNPGMDFDPNTLTYDSVECEGNSDLVLDWSVPFTTIPGIDPWYGDAGTTLMIKFSAIAGKVSEVIVNGTSIKTTGGVVKEKGEGFVKVDPTKLPDDAYSTVIVKAENGEFTFVIKKGDATEFATSEEPSEGMTTDEDGNLSGDNLANLKYETIECVDKEGTTLDYYVLKEIVGWVEPWYGDKGSTFQFRFSADSGKIVAVTVNDEPAANGVVTEEMPGSVKINPIKLKNDAYSVINVVAENGDFTVVIRRGKPEETTTPGEVNTTSGDEKTTTEEITTPEESVPAYTTPEYTTPAVTTPERTTPDRTTPQYTMPQYTTPVYTTPAAKQPTTQSGSGNGTGTTTVAPAATTVAATAVSVGKTKVKKVTKKLASKKAKISLKKISGAKYQVKVSTTKKFKAKNTVTKKKVTKTTFTVNSKKIANKTVLYVKARAYKVVGGKTYYGKWSKVKKVKIKK